MVFVKMGVAIAAVLLLSFFAEAVSPRFAGILCGYPLGAAITLFFVGYDINPGFASESALYTAIGLIATQASAYGYYRFSLLSKDRGRVSRVVISTIGGLAGFFPAAVLLSLVRVNPLTAALLPAASILLFIFLFRGVENVRIERRSATGMRALLVRAVFAATVVFAATSSAKAVGPAWAGLFAAFPMTMLPSAMIIHFTYDSEHAHAFLKNVPRGLGSVIIYSLALWVFYPEYGVFAGTIICYAFATAYLVILSFGAGRRIISLGARYGSLPYEKSLSIEVSEASAGLPQSPCTTEGRVWGDRTTPETRICGDQSTHTGGFHPK